MIEQIIKGMNHVTVDNSFTHYSTPALIVFSERIITKMVNDSRFVNIHSLFDELILYNDELSKWFNSSSYNSPETIAKMDKTREKSIELLRLIAQRVGHIAKGNQSVIHECGFYCNKHTENC